MMIAFRPRNCDNAGTTYVLIADYDALRRIFTDGRDWPAEIEPTSRAIRSEVDRRGCDGKFDMLEVETRASRETGSTTSPGIPLHRDNRSVFKERIFIDKKDRNILHDEITVIDNALTRPWTVDKRYVAMPISRPPSGRIHLQ